MIKNGIPVYLISWCKNFLDDHYSSFILPTLTKTRIRKLQDLQNNAIKIIHDKDFKESTVSLKEISGLPHIVSRYQILNKKYFDSAIINSNPLIEELMGKYNINILIKEKMMKIVYNSLKIIDEWLAIPSNYHR
ncbi:unnamed protein product [Brachionus calyciflorus]|uniref:Uncharacterized protein n=1 Tax=Brachionus calyciflorus TaxID=104777 RepID=A0A814FB90_9BILA|nr:unnamed protein product [Brachionus calyciflorus]